MNDSTPLTKFEYWTIRIVFWVGACTIIGVISYGLERWLR